MLASFGKFYRYIYIAIIGISIITSAISTGFGFLSNYCQDDFCLNYLNSMTEGRKITNNLEENTIYPLKHVKHQWICDWVESTNIKYSSRKEMNEDNNKEILNFLEKHIPNVQESIIQSVNYLEKNNQQQE